MAAREIDGVYKLGKGVLQDTMARMTRTRETREGVEAEVGKKEVAIDLEMVVEYGYSIPETANKVRTLIAKRVEFMTGLVTKEVNIEVVGIHYDPEPQSPRVS